MRRLKYKRSKRLLWVDTVCINQDDVDEGDRQLRLMRSIYRGATRVVIWLGEDSERDGTLVFSPLQRAWMSPSLKHELGYW